MSTTREDRVQMAIEGLLRVAESNFPSPSNIRIEATGTHSATIHLSASELRKLLAPQPDAGLVELP